VAFFMKQMGARPEAACNEIGLPRLPGNGSCLDNSCRQLVLEDSQRRRLGRNGRRIFRVREFPEAREWPVPKANPRAAVAAEIRKISDDVRSILGRLEWAGVAWNSRRRPTGTGDRLVTSLNRLTDAAGDVFELAVEVRMGRVAINNPDESPRPLLDRPPADFGVTRPLIGLAEAKAKTGRRSMLSNPSRTARSSQPMEGPRRESSPTRPGCCSPRCGRTRSRLGL